MYSIDEVFIDATRYLASYHLTARKLAMGMIHDIHATTGITATAGIGTNLYLCKIAMDIEAKHIPADKDGVRLAELDEMLYRQKLWSHRPLTDFWRVGRGYAKKLEANGLYTMGDIARCSLGKKTDYNNEDFLYKLFGVNAELLIDHAWGWEPCTMEDIKAYKPQSNSLGAGQVLGCPYDFEKGKLIVREMTELLVLDLVDKQLMTDQIVMTVGYDVESLTSAYTGEVTTDHYGRSVPKSAHGTANIDRQTSSTRLIMNAVLSLYDCIVDPKLLVRRVYLTANHVVNEHDAAKPSFEQLDMFTNYAQKGMEEAELERERKMQHTMLGIQKKFGKNAILKGMNLQEGAKTIERNKQIGGHKA